MARESVFGRVSLEIPPIQCLKAEEVLGNVCKSKSGKRCDFLCLNRSTALAFIYRDGRYGGRLDLGNSNPGTRRTNRPMAIDNKATVYRKNQAIEG